MSLKLAFYGDDFTGSTDAMEALAMAGLRTALFLAPPDRATLDAVGPLDALGVAGSSRAMSPQAMGAHLPAVFAALARSGAPVVHYKVCSTFDSAPEIGSIGCAMELARQAFATSWIPVVGGTPALRRYCAFGHLFARSATDDHVYRIDRHPIMKVHPVTPMHESDLVLHLGQQTGMPMGNLPFTALERGAGRVDEELDALIGAGAHAVVLDSLSQQHLTEVGSLIWRHADAERPLFVVGPSGVEYALTQWWRASGQGGSTAAARWPALRPASGVLAVSASASMLSALQIEAAVRGGYVPVAVDASALVSAATAERACEALAQDVRLCLQRGHSVLLHTACGPEDRRIALAAQAVQQEGQLDESQARREAGLRLSVRLGELTRAVLQHTPVDRLLLSGGDSSSRIVGTLAPQALRMVAPLAPGAPMCELISEQPWLHGMQIALKGGQMGDVEFFNTARNGPTRNACKGDASNEETA